MKVLLVAAARPNFMKVGPIYHEMKRRGGFFHPVLVHTGQHYDKNMSSVFFEDLSLPEPDVYLGVGSGSHAEQTGKIMIEFEKICKVQKPDCVIVVGDVNSTLACAVTAVKMCIPLAHVEAGLRSYDRTMPEEINRIITDSVSTMLFTPSRDADETLLREGHAGEEIIFVGNVMIDSLVSILPKIENDRTYRNHGLEEKKYILLTMHRPSNVDDPGILLKILDIIVKAAENFKMVFPVHPRTLNTLKSLNVLENKEYTNIIFMEPLNYISFISLMKHSLCVVTDSGGVQEETTYLKIPCLTMRNNTERPVTVTVGSNELVTLDNIGLHLKMAISGRWKSSSVPEFWDGRTAGRIVDFFMNNFQTHKMSGGVNA